MIEIKIKGPPKSGKTVIASEIADTMRQCGYAVMVDDGDESMVSYDNNPTIHIYTEQDYSKRSNHPPTAPSKHTNRKQILPSTNWGVNFPRSRE